MHLVKKQAGEGYTQNLFTMFEKEFTNSRGCVNETLSEGGDNAVHLRDHHNEEKSMWMKVEYVT